MYTIAQKTFAIGQKPHYLTYIFILLEDCRQRLFFLRPCKDNDVLCACKIFCGGRFLFNWGRRSLHVPKVYRRRCSLYLRFAKDTEVRGQQRRLSFGDTSGRRLSPHLRSMNGDFLLVIPPDDAFLLTWGPWTTTFLAEGTFAVIKIDASTWNISKWRHANHMKSPN
jgi:hypothetical protein